VNLAQRAEWSKGVNAGQIIVIGQATGSPISPIVLFVLLVAVTMRARLLTDLANLVFWNWGYRAAESVVVLTRVLTSPFTFQQPIPPQRQLPQNSRSK
jgi:hypothetical protein